MCVLSPALRNRTPQIGPKSSFLCNWRPPNRSQTLVFGVCHATNRSQIAPPAQLGPQIGPNSAIVCKWMLHKGPQLFKMCAKSFVHCFVFSTTSALRKHGESNGATSILQVRNSSTLVLMPAKCAVPTIFVFRIYQTVHQKHAAPTKYAKPRFRNSSPTLVSNFNFCPQELFENVYKHTNHSLRKFSKRLKKRTQNLHNM